MTTTYLPLSKINPSPQAIENAEQSTSSNSPHDIIVPPVSIDTNNERITIKTITEQPSPNNVNSEQMSMITSSRKTTIDPESPTLKPAAKSIGVKSTTQTALDASKPASVKSSIFNLLNTAVGAGILALPYATAQVGWILALVLFAGCAILNAYQLHINSMAAKVYRPKSSYKVLSNASIKYLSYFVDIIIAIAEFGACCAYLIIVGKLWPDIIRHFDENLNAILYDRRLWIGIYFVLFILPCIYWRKLDALRHVSFIAMLCYVYITIVVLVFAIIGIDHEKQANTTIPGEIHSIPYEPLHALKALPVFLFAYSCIANTFPIVNELENCTKKRVNIIINSSMSFVFVLYIIMGFAGYFTFGDNCSDMILSDYPTDLNSILIARILLSFCVTFSYPVIFNPCRHCVASLFFCKQNANKDELETWKFVLMTTIIWILTLIVAMTVESLGLVIAVNGAISTTAMVFVLPGLYYWFLKDQEQLMKDEWYKFKRYSSMGMTILGVILIPFSVARIFVEF